METIVEIRKIRAWLKKHRRPAMCVRILLVYLVCLMIVKYSVIFDQGILGSGTWGRIIGLITLFYRFLSFAFVPGLLILWISEKLVTTKKDKH